MRGSYAIFCNESGMLMDDAVLYKNNEQDYLLMVAEVNHDEYFETLQARFDDVSIDECTSSLDGVALQGPLSTTVLSKFGFEGIENLRPFEMKYFGFAGGVMAVARLGFTADLGYELWFKPDLCKAFEQAVIDAEKALDVNIAGYGLTAIQICRMEGAFIVPGWDCAQQMEENPDFERSPYELGLAWMVKLDGGDFVGKAALREKKRFSISIQLL